MKLSQAKIQAMLKLSLMGYKTADEMKVHLSTLRALRDAGLAKERGSMMHPRTTLLWMLTPEGVALRSSQNLRVGNGN